MTLPLEAAQNPDTEDNKDTSGDQRGKKQKNRKYSMML